MIWGQHTGPEMSERERERKRECVCVCVELTPWIGSELAVFGTRLTTLGIRFRV